MKHFFYLRNITFINVLSKIYSYNSALKLRSITSASTGCAGIAWLHPHVMTLTAALHL